MRFKRDLGLTISRIRYIVSLQNIITFIKSYAGVYERHNFEDERLEKKFQHELRLFFVKKKYEVVKLCTLFLF